MRSSVPLLLCSVSAGIHGQASVFDQRAAAAVPAVVGNLPLLCDRWVAPSSRWYVLPLIPFLAVVSKCLANLRFRATGTPGNPCW
jgi:hypothetical protein